MWEEIYQLYQDRTTPIPMTHVYGHNKLVYNEEADAFAKAGAALSKMHRPRCVMDMPRGSPEATRRKRTRGRGIKRQAAVQVLDGSIDSDRPGQLNGIKRCQDNTQRTAEGMN